MGVTCGKVCCMLGGTVGFSRGCSQLALFTCSLWTVLHLQHTPLPPLGHAASCPRDQMCLLALGGAQRSHGLPHFAFVVQCSVTDWDLSSAGFRFRPRMPCLRHGAGAAASGESKVPWRICSRARPGCSSPHCPGERLPLVWPCP